MSSPNRFSGFSRESDRQSTRDALFFWESEVGAERCEAISAIAKLSEVVYRMATRHPPGGRSETLRAELVMLAQIGGHPNLRGKTLRRISKETGLALATLGYARKRIVEIFIPSVATGILKK
jgi:hypothetical protein